MLTLLKGSFVGLSIVFTSTHSTILVFASLHIYFKLYALMGF